MQPAVAIREPLMRLRLSGAGIPADLLELVGAMTDRARLRHAEVTHDQPAGKVRLPLTRLPLVKERRVLPNVHETGSPIESVVCVRGVESAEIVRNIPPELGAEVMLQFGIQIREGEVYLSSAEEVEGAPCFTVKLQIAEFDVEIVDAD